jgi:mercuric ion transport protein
MKSPKKNFYTSSIGSVFVAICCFTPVLLISLGIVGFGVFAPYLDYVLYPLLILSLVLVWVSYGKYKRSCDCEAGPSTEELKK